MSVVSDACARVPSLRRAKLHLIPPEERSSLYDYAARVAKCAEVRVGNWVEITTGGFKGQIGILRAVCSDGLLEVLIVPRFCMDFHGKRVFFGPALFDPDWVRARGGIIEVGLPGDLIFEKGLYERGLRVLVLDGFASVRRIHPDLRDDRMACFILSGIHLGDLESSHPLLRRQDRVQLTAGPYASVIGTVEDFDEEHAVVDIEIKEARGKLRESVQAKREELQRALRHGDSVRVAVGEHTGVQGAIVGMQELTLQGYVTRNDSRQVKDALLTIQSREGGVNRMV